MSIAPTTTTVGGTDDRWNVHEEHYRSAITATLDISAFTENDHYPDGYIPSGTPVKLITQTGLYGPADETSTAATLAGFVKVNVAVNGTADLPFALMRTARVVASLVPGTHDLEDGVLYICSASAIASTAT